ncbi:hypothetical protein J2S46_008212 [Kitasatospora herbaricolor]|nr:hypothetical protein [Kitasatospora herbaricolor]
MEGVPGLGAGAAPHRWPLVRPRSSAASVGGCSRGCERAEVGGGWKGCRGWVPVPHRTGGRSCARGRRPRPWVGARVGASVPGCWVVGGFGCACACPLPPAPRYTGGGVPVSGWANVSGVLGRWRGPVGAHIRSRPPGVRAAAPARPVGGWVCAGEHGCRRGRVHAQPPCVHVGVGGWASERGPDVWVLGRCGPVCTHAILLRAFAPVGGRRAPGGGGGGGQGGLEGSVPVCGRCPLVCPGVCAAAARWCVRGCVPLNGRACPGGGDAAGVRVRGCAWPAAACLRIRAGASVSGWANVPRVRGRWVGRGPGAPAYVYVPDPCPHPHPHPYPSRAGQAGRVRVRVLGCARTRTRTCGPAGTGS